MFLETILRLIYLVLHTKKASRFLISFVYHIFLGQNRQNNLPLFLWYIQFVASMSASCNDASKM